MRDEIRKMCDLTDKPFGVNIAQHFVRDPGIVELHSLVDYSVSSPAIHLAFNFGCAPGCTVLDCSCSASGIGLHWISTTAAPGFGRAFALRFDDGTPFTAPVLPPAPMAVRAVRGGL